MMKTKIILPFCFIILSSVFGGDCFAQLDSIHWIPPLHSRDNSQVADHYLYLSTPSVNPFIVTIKDGAGNVLASPIINNTNPFTYTIGNGQTSGSPSFVRMDSLNKILKRSGLIVSAPERFYANLRVRSASQSDCLSGQGKAGTGTTFRVGGFPMSLTGQQSTWNFCASVMATENNTTVTIKGYNPGVVFAGTTTVTLDSLTFTLNAGECYVVAGYTNTSANLRGFIGALVQSNHPIVLNNGNLLGNITSGGSQGQDIGIDQTVPIEKIGQQYILIEGNGSSLTEIPIVIAHYDSTAVFVNGSFVPDTILNGGQFYMVPNSKYYGTCNQNMHIRTSHPAYMYQSLAGATATQTVALNFIPPYSCWLQDTIDNIPAVNMIGNTTYSGGIMVFTELGATLKINGVVQTCAEPVLSVPWETYKILGLTGNAVITSTGIVAAGIFGYNSDAGFAGYYAGFSEIPSLSAGLDTSVCRGASVQLNASATVAGTYTWLPSAGLSNPNISNPVASPSSTTTYTATLTGDNGCTVSNSITITVDSSFSITISDTPITCHGDNDGSATVTVSGGIPPYTYAWSPTGGTNPTATGLSAGTYTVTVTDASVCSATTQTVTITEPAEIMAAITSSKNIMCAGDSARVCAPSGYASYQWNMGQTDSCIKAQLAGNYYVTITDNNGCSVESNHLAIVVHPLPPVSISVNGDTLSVYGALTQQWYLNGSAINGATSNIYIATQGGSYTVAVTDSNGCVATSSAVLITGINNLSEEDEVSVYQLTVDGWELTVGNKWIGGVAEVFDVNSKVVFKSEIRNSKFEIVLNAARGVYLLRISSAKGSVVRKLIRL